MIKKFPEAIIEESTIASLLNKENANNLLNVLSEGPTDLWISFHGIDKKTYEGIIGLHFENFFKVINLLRQAKVEILIYEL